MLLFCYCTQWNPQSVIRQAGQTGWTRALQHLLAVETLRHMTRWDVPTPTVLMMRSAQLETLYHHPPILPLINVALNFVGWWHIAAQRQILVWMGKNFKYVVRKVVCMWMYSISSSTDQRIIVFSAQLHLHSHVPQYYKPALYAFDGFMTYR